MKKWILPVLTVLLMQAMLFASTAGKITGHIKTRDEGKPLMGVNVYLEGTFLGATTDENGYYVIVNVPVGSYNLKLSYIGYQTLTVQGVEVSIDLTTIIDAQMSPQVLESSESVIVIAEKPLLKADEFSSKHLVSSEEMNVQPVDNILAIAQNQAGVVGNNFRGGRSNEVLVVIDGIPVRDPSAAYTGDMGGFTLGVPKESVEEMEVSLGGFSAEYGNVQSGILNLAMKEGSDKLKIMLYATTTDFGGLNDLIMDKEPWWYDAKYQHKLENNYRFSINGPIGIPNGYFSLSGDIFDKKQGYFLNQDEFSQSYQGKYTQRLGQKAKLTIGGNYTKRDWNYFYFQAGKYGFGENYQQDLYEFVERVDSDNDTLIRYHYVDDIANYASMQGKVDSLLNTRWEINADSDSVAVNYYQEFYLDAPINHLTSRSKESRMFYGVLSYSFSSKTFAELRAQIYSSSYINGMRDYADRDNDGNTDEFLQWDGAVEGPRPEALEREYNFWWLRGDDREYRNQSVSTYMLKGDLTSQLHKYHYVKSGFQFNWNQTDVTDITWSNVDNSNGFVLNTLRKDIWQEDDIDFGLYVQDKMEFQSDLVAMVGLRFDYFNPNGFGDPILYPGNLNNPIKEIDKETGYAVFNEPQEAEPSWQFSPRIGISHPISDRDVLFFTYGHYFQRPDGRYLFRNYQHQSLTKVGNWVGNPALKPEKTVAYDVSFEHLFTKNFKMSITGYFKDVSNLVNNARFIFPDGTEISKYVNGDYANIKGVELAFRRLKTRYWSMQGNISYSIAKGRSSASGEQKFYPYDKKMYYLDFDRRINTNLNLTLFSDKGTYFLPLVTRNWMMNIQFDYGTGKPWTTFGKLGANNDRRLPDYTNVDIRFNRNFNVQGLSLSLYLDIFNVLNNDVYYGIYSQYFDEYEIPNIIYREELTNTIIQTPTIYPAERQFKLGVSLAY